MQVFLAVTVQGRTAVETLSSTVPPLGCYSRCIAALTFEYIPPRSMKLKLAEVSEFLMGDGE